ncbi:MAG: DUF4271 domain-containing protein [Bacteroidales bacterium]|jgi:hypothetical protein|nr:DUF4271 domain-containing protein [Bacteroidales bacterium]
MLQEMPVYIYNKDTSKEGNSVRYNYLSKRYEENGSSVAHPQSAGSFIIAHPASSFEHRPLPSLEFDWVFIISFIFLMLLGLIKVIFLRTPQMLSYRMLMRKTYKKTNYLKEMSNSYFSTLPFMMCSWIVYSLILYTFIHPLFDYSNNMTLFLSFCFTLLLFVIRFFLFKIVELLFGIKNIISMFRHLTKTIDFFIAFLSFPFVIMNCYYSHLFLTISIIVIFSALFLYRIFMEWGFLKQSFQMYEYFLYLCTIEILPLLILLKFISNKLLVS